jgi:hypothetical protein
MWSIRDFGNPPLWGFIYVAADVIVPGDDNPKVRACRVKEVKDSRSFRETAHCWVLKKKQLLQGGHEVK